MKSNVLFAFLLIVSGAVALASAYSRLTTGENAHESQANATSLFAGKCAKCHGKDGRARGIRKKFLGARDLTNRDWQERVSDERIFNVVSNGKGRMPAFAKDLSETEIESLVQYVRGLKR